MTNNKKLTKKSKWLKLTLISTASLSTLAIVPSVICCANANNTNDKTQPVSPERNSAFCKISFKLRQSDIDVGATIAGPIFGKIKKGGHFGPAIKPVAKKTGFKFVGWSTSDTVQNPDAVLPDDEVINTNIVVYAVFDQNGDIAISGTDTVSNGEFNIQYSAKILPEGVPQDVDWYTCESLNNPKTPAANTHIDPASGVLRVDYDRVVGGSFYVFAVIKGHAIPETITEFDTRAIKVHVVEPWANPTYADEIFVDYETDNGNYECTVEDQDELYNANGTVQLRPLNNPTAESVMTVNKTDFNYPIHFGKEVTAIKDNFLPVDEDEAGNKIGFINFNKELIFPHVVHVGSGFLAQNPTFNQPVTFSDNLKSIGSFFMAESIKFNDVLDLGNSVTQIGDNFLDGCSAFTKVISLPSSLIEIGQAFMLDCPITEISINCKAEAFRECASTLAMGQYDDVAITHDVKVSGSVSLEELKTLFPDNATKSEENPYIRVLKNQ